MSKLYGSSLKFLLILREKYEKIVKDAPISSKILKNSQSRALQTEVSVLHHHPHPAHIASCLYSSGAVHKDWMPQKYFGSDWDLPPVHRVRALRAKTSIFSQYLAIAGPDIVQKGWPLQKLASVHRQTHFGTSHFWVKPRLL